MKQVERFPGIDQKDDGTEESCQCSMYVQSTTSIRIQIRRIELMSFNVIVDGYLCECKYAETM